MTIGPLSLVGRLQRRLNINCNDLVTNKGNTSLPRRRAGVIVIK